MSIPADVRQVAQTFAAQMARMPSWVGGKQTEQELLAAYEVAPEDKRAALVADWQKRADHLATFNVVCMHVSDHGIDVEVRPGK